MKWDDFKKNVSLAPQTSWLVGGAADYFIEPSSIGEVGDAQRLAADNKQRLTVLGGGTNVLIGDKGLRGVVISLKNLSGIEILEEKEELVFWALSGTPKSELLKLFLKRKLEPACFLAGLPGQVGGGVVMNAGVSENLVPREFKEIVRAVEVLRPQGTLETIESGKLSWDYRHCSGWQPGIITRVLIAWPMNPRDDVLAKVKALNQSRLKKQPLEWPSCGSVFRNPLPHHAGQLIDEVGLKGFSIGDAQISQKHGNFIINKGKASAKDIKALIDLCVKKVMEEKGIELRSEVICLGEY